jgi:hypothetical protein
MLDILDYPAQLWKAAGGVLAGLVGLAFAIYEGRRYRRALQPPKGREFALIDEDGARSRGRAIFLGWVLCGVLDITSAIVIALANNGSPIRMLQGIAGAVLGPQTYDYGFATAAMGLAMHFGVAFAATVIFYWLSRRIPAMVDHAVLAGILYGVFWLLVMYRGVIPLMAALRPLYLANAPKRPLPPLFPLPILVHMTCVGLPIALAVRRFGPRPAGARKAVAA